MTPTLAAFLLALLAYLLGSIPFGYLVARTRGVNIFTAGSGNIGATNVARVCGRPWGVLVFLLDFGKGAVGASLAALFAGFLPEGTAEAIGSLTALRVILALSVLLGHLFPVTIGFRGGKGIATGLGVVVVLVPIPALMTAIAWVATTVASRCVSFGSLLAVVVLVTVHLLITPTPFSGEALILTMFCIVGGTLVFVRHHANIARLWAGTENRLSESSMRHTFSKLLHVMALGLWFGGSIAFIAAAPIIFSSFKQAVEEAPSQRTAYFSLGTEDEKAQRVDAGEDPDATLGNALAGTAVGPLFTPFYVTQGVCGLIALTTAIGWCLGSRRKVDHLRAWVIGLALVSVGVGYWLAEKVASLRVERYAPDGSVNATVKAAFDEWHQYSLGMLMVTAILVTIAMALTAMMPDRSSDHPAG